MHCSKMHLDAVISTFTQMFAFSVILALSAGSVNRIESDILFTGQLEQRSNYEHWNFSKAWNAGLANRSKYDFHFTDQLRPRTNYVDRNLSMVSLIDGRYGMLATTLIIILGLYRIKQSRSQCFHAASVHYINNVEFATTLVHVVEW